MNNFKAGDKVKHVKGYEFSNDEFVCTVKRVVDGYEVWLDETDTWIECEFLELVQPSPNKKHKHHDLIIAWANGAKIQGLLAGHGVWINMNNPTWHDGTQYRIKPEKSEREIEIEKIEIEKIENAMRKLADRLNDLQEYKI